MFSHLTDFGFKRDTKQAIGFYIAYLVLALVIGAAVGLLSSFFVASSGQQIIGIGTIVAMIYVLIISILILKSKQMLTIQYIILAIVAFILAYFGGGILGLIIPAFLTTKGTGTTAAPQAETPSDPTAQA